MSRERSRALAGLRHRAIEARRRASSAGNTLVEVVISLLLVSIIVTSVFTVTLSTKADTGKEDRHVVATQSAKEITAALRNFVTACCSVTTGGCALTAGVANTCYFDIAGKAVPGPNLNGGFSAASWSFNNYQLYSGAPAIVDTDTTYALHQGQHNLTNVLPAWFVAAPFNATFSYTVTPVAAGSQPSVPSVNVVVNWTEPKGP